MTCSVCSSNTPQAGCPACGVNQTTLALDRQRIASIEIHQGRLAALRALERAVIVALVGCSKQKQPDPAPARELYTGDLFRLAMGYAGRAADETFILSAKYGLLRHNDWIGPYDRSMRDLARRDRLAWGEEVTSRLAAYLPSFRLRLVMLAGQDYAAPLVKAVGTRPWSVERPLRGRGIGEQMQWLKAEQERLSQQPLGVHPPINRGEKSWTNDPPSS